MGDQQRRRVWGEGPEQDHLHAKFKIRPSDLGRGHLAGGRDPGLDAPGHVQSWGCTHCYTREDSPPSCVHGAAGLMGEGAWLPSASRTHPTQPWGDLRAHVQPEATSPGPHASLDEDVGLLTSSPRTLGQTANLSSHRHQSHAGSRSAPSGPLPCPGAGPGTLCPSFPWSGPPGGRGRLCTMSRRSRRAPTLQRRSSCGGPGGWSEVEGGARPQSHPPGAPSPPSWPPSGRLIMCSGVAPGPRGLSRGLALQPHWRQT